MDGSLALTPKLVNAKEGVRRGGIVRRTMACGGTRWNAEEHGEMQCDMVEYREARWGMVEHGGTLWNTVEYSWIRCASGCGGMQPSREWGG
eukprot:10379929-Lingulodinium_polyedra.AAC.1